MNKNDDGGNVSALLLIGSCFAALLLDACSECPDCEANSPTIIIAIQPFTRGYDADGECH